LIRVLKLRLPRRLVNPGSSGGGLYAVYSNELYERANPATHVRRPAHRNGFNCNGGTARYRFVHLPLITQPQPRRLTNHTGAIRWPHQAMASLIAHAVDLFDPSFQGRHIKPSGRTILNNQHREASSGCCGMHVTSYFCWPWIRGVL
jgi:hypothetical protein